MIMESLIPDRLGRDLAVLTMALERHELDEAERILNRLIDNAATLKEDLEQRKGAS